jgi:NAD(P)-dependent dehydrogenase (short-subunit alcohol dehydrogenase family)
LFDLRDGGLAPAEAMIEPHNSDPCSICSVTLDLLFIQPEEVAELAFFLSQSGARSITGADMAIDCGVCAGNCQ